MQIQLLNQANKTMILILLFFLVSSFNTEAQNVELKQKKSYRFYINQPLDLATKFRATVEQRFNQKYAMLINYTTFYGFYPGQHGYLELRRYSTNPKNSEYFPYVKLGIGNTFTSVGFYGLFGLGVGNIFYLTKSHRYSFDIKYGLKYSPDVIGKHDICTSCTGLGGLYYVTGPGAIIDINMNFGLRF